MLLLLDLSGLILRVTVLGPFSLLYHIIVPLQGALVNYLSVQAEQLHLLGIGRGAHVCEEATARND